LDPLSRILRALRLGSSVVSRSHLSAPWAIESPGGDCAIFHAVVEGRCWLRRLVDADPIALGEGDVVVLTHGDPHVVSSTPRGRPAPLSALKRTRMSGGVAVLEHGGGGAATRIICGKFRLEHDGGGTVLALLPPLLHAPAGTAALGPWIDTTLRLLDGEIDGADLGIEAMLARLTDVLFVQVLRRHFARGVGERGWLAAVQDPIIGRALALVHDEPGGPWSAGELGARVGLSRTRFFERWSELMGEPPARYVARWRVHAAIDLMRRQGLSTAQVAERVGYSSEDAFNKVFKRHVGVSPSVFRRRLRTDAPALAVAS
jgi:AraC-like DNA-binding protein